MGSLIPAELLDRLREGDADAMGELLQHYRPYLRVLAERGLDPLISARLSGSDVVQQTCLEALRDIQQFRGQSVEEFQVWLTQILKHNLAGPAVEEQPEDESTISQARAVQKETVIVADAQTTGEQDDAGRALVGKHLGDYEILDVLGAGGMGVVYHARQIGMSRDVALKMIRSGCLATENDVQRFYLEAQAAGRLTHHLIVKVYEVGELEGHHFFSMEHISGTSLSHFAREQALSPQQIAELLRQIAEAIDYAHQQGVLHRDLKPSNILVDSLGRPRITDFGLAKDLASGTELTDSGSALGTPSYMPPEQAQARRDEISCRSDVYSLGAILYALLTNRPPFRGESLLETLNQVIDDEPIPPRDLNPNCPRDLEAICLKCLQKSPEDRYDSAHALAEDLSRFLSSDRVNARRSRFYDRAWSWLRNVPFISAATGRKSSRATVWHLAFQWSVIVVLMLIAGGIFLLPKWEESQRLEVVDVSTGVPGRPYHRIGQLLGEVLHSVTGREVAVHHSAGAVESHARLLHGDVDLAFLQENTLESQRLKVLAPLYRELVLILVRKEAGIREIADLSGKKIALGKEGSGMRISSRKILRHYGLRESDLDDVNHSYSDLLVDVNKQFQGAIVTIKQDDSDLKKLLGSGEFELLPYPKNSDIPGFRGWMLDQDKDKEKDELSAYVPEEGLWVPTTFAILAVRRESPDSFVNACLNALYEQDGIANRNEDIFRLDQAAEWGDLNYHRAAHQFFSQARNAEAAP